MVSFLSKPQLYQVRNFSTRPWDHCLITSGCQCCDCDRSQEPRFRIQSRHRVSLISAPQLNPDRDHPAPSRLSPDNSSFPDKTWACRQQTNPFLHISVFPILKKVFKVFGFFVELKPSPSSHSSVSDQVARILQLIRSWFGDRIAK